MMPFDHMHMFMGVARRESRAIETVDPAGGWASGVRR